MASFSVAQGGEFTRGHGPRWVAGDGSFSLGTNLRALPLLPGHFGYWPSLLLLGALQAMHVVWFGMMCQMLYANIAPTKTLTSASATADAEYERRKAD